MQALQVPDRGVEGLAATIPPRCIVDPYGGATGSRNLLQRIACKEPNPRGTPSAAREIIDATLGR